MKFSRIFFTIAAIFLCFFFSETQLHAKILVVSPHPDDDLITSAGVIARAVARGEEVRVVYMTNGDYLGVSNGYLRQGEAVSGESILGIPENNLIFLGYPDGYLTTIFTSYVNADDQYMSPNEVSATYGNRGLGSTDYHAYRFGSHAAYNRYNILVDLEDIIASYLPDHILVTSEFDTLPDHATTYQLVRLAVLSVNSGNSSYYPVIHKTIVHWADSSSTVITWPDPMDPSAFITALPAVSDTGSTWAETGLAWSDRESIDVPLAMQSTDYAVNPKYLAVSEHVSQGGVYQLLGWFIHKDEIFWAENILSANHPPIVNAGPDQTVTQGQGPGIVQLDGSQSRDPDGGQLTFQWVQSSGPAVTLSDPTNASPSFTVPAGLTQNEVFTFELVVSDGQFTSLSDSVKISVIATQPDAANIASLAAVTASSENTQDGQTAVKAVDGVIDGYPGDYTREWATRGQGVGAWLRLSWSVPYNVNRVALHDRPNGFDNITSATITFSDGSSITVGALHNDGTTTTYDFPAKVITGLTMTVTGVSGNTYNVGLSEIQVYGTQAGGTQYSLTTTANPSGGGMITASPAQAGYSSGTQVTLTAVPSTGYTFSGWSGGATGSSNPTTITMNANTSVIANFAAVQYSLTTTANPSGGGSIMVNPSQAGYNSGQQVTLTATPNAGYAFSGWSGGATGTANPLTITMASNTSMTANFTATSGTLAVTPSAGLASTGASGGPFTPSTITYTLLNSGDALISWFASATQSWVTLSSNSGSLAPGASTTVTVTINSNANGLAAGSYSDTVTFTNVTNGTGNTTRVVSLTIAPRYSLTVGASPSGSGSVTVNPNQSSYSSGQQVTLTAAANAGYTFSNWSGGATGTTNPLTITMTGNTSMTANFTAIPGALTVTPSSGLTASGVIGGPFSPSSATYTLQNNGNGTINWSASATQSWVTLSSNSGSLAAGASTTVVVTINSNANSLTAGSYNDTVTFANLTNGNGNSSRGVGLSITATQPTATNIALLAAVTASSDNPADGQTAAKAIDGVIDGYPGDYTKEWATHGQGVGAWLTLGWPVPYSVNKIVLYDRPNSFDYLTSATVTFSDGSSITVGPLNNDGTATTYSFSARVITGLTMTVTGVGGNTYNVGLSEMQVFGTQAGY